MNLSQINHKVAVWQGKAIYPEIAPFHPSQAYPEYQWSDLSLEYNSVYEGVRESFNLLGLDQKKYNTPDWNPLRNLIKPGDTVLLKPNFVKEFHPRDPEGWQYVLTHGSVIRAVADYVWKALEGNGKIIVADAPQTDSSFSKIVSILQLDKVAEFYQSQGVVFELVDLRNAEWISVDDVVVNRHKLTGDPNGYIAYDLEQQSEFVGHAGSGHYYGADYDSQEVNRHHNGQKNEYLLAGTAIQCDVFFNLPKLKTHKKAGITVSLKNLVGINGDKNWLPHHTEGFPSSGGDEFREPVAKRNIERRLVKLMHKISIGLPIIGPQVHLLARKVGKKLFGDTDDVIRNGNWYGNDTTWRMCLDLNKLVLYGNLDGSLRDDTFANRKRYYSLVDGIIAGEGRGPMNPDPKEAGVILFGVNPAVVDAASAIIMGFDPDKIPIVRQAFKCRHFPIAERSWQDIEAVSNNSAWQGILGDIDTASTFHFEPHFGWKGYVER